MKVAPIWGRRLCVSLVMCYYSDKAKILDEQWGLALKDKSLPYFHMTDCAHGTPPFDQLCLQERIEIETRMIGLIKDLSEYGFAISINERDYQKLVPDELRTALGSAYTFCIRQCLTAVKHWADKNGFDGQVAYFFESGHDRQGEANRLLKDVYASQEILANHIRYVSHTFADKRVVLPLQSADILAWQWFTQCKRDKNLAPRKDLIALLREQDRKMEWNADNLTSMTSYLYEQAEKYAKSQP